MEHGSMELHGRQQRHSTGPDSLVRPRRVLSQPCPLAGEPSARPHAALPTPQPKAPPPQHLLSNAAQILPPLPAGVATPFTPPMRTFCTRYQNARCRRQCSLHMTPAQRTHAHVFALHGLPVAALLPPLVRWRCLASLSHILSNIWTCLFPASQHHIDWWTASDCRWYLARLPMPPSRSSSEPEIGSSTSASDC